VFLTRKIKGFDTPSVAKEKKSHATPHRREERKEKIGRREENKRK
jgi:hypothetical protein